MIYLDHNATNPPAPRLLAAYREALESAWANPSSPHAVGRRARALLEEARERVAALARVPPGQVTFCSSGTEAINLAIHSAIATGAESGAVPARVVTSPVEHPAVLGPLEQLAQAGRIELQRAPVDEDGRIALAEFQAALEGAALGCLIAAQNETGVLQPLDSLAAPAAPLLVDATQAAGRLVRDWGSLPWDYLVFSGHKMRAPRGAAALVHRGRGRPRAQILGGPQELGRRAGTESVAAAHVLGLACELTRQGQLCDPAALGRLRRRLEVALQEAVPGLTVVAEDAPRLPQTSLVLVPGGDSEALVMQLDLAGVAVSSGSACSSGALEPSHVLAAMGLSPEQTAGRLRFSFGPETTEEELLAAARILGRLRPG